MSLRRRLERSPRVAAVLAVCVGSYLALCQRTTKWQMQGLDELRLALAEGPVLLVMWHSRSVMAALHWPVQDGPLSSLYASSAIGRVSGALQRSVGLHAMEMSDSHSNKAASRMILRRVRDGFSIGMTGDGPTGPARQFNDAALDWARATGVPVFAYGFSVQKGRRLKTWDQMLLPKLFGQGAVVFKRFGGEVPRRLNQNEREVLRRSLQGFLDETTAQADFLARVEPAP